MSNHYDTAGMRDCANRIAQELKQYNTHRRELENVISRAGNYAWRDTVSRQFLQRYHNEAKPIEEDIDTTVNRFQELLLACSNRFSNVIDDGNAWLSGK